jgi:hypothetical protein
MHLAFGNKNSQAVYLVDLAQDHFEVRLNGFAEWRNPHGRSALEQGTVPIPGEAARRSGMMPPTDSEMISPTVPR